jgi:hypothetical protein
MMMPRMPPTVDRSIAKMIAYKRIFTGAFALAAGVILAVLTIANGRPWTPLLLVALAIFFGGGVWTLRDGLRVRRELRRG